THTHLRAASPATLSLHDALPIFGMVLENRLDNVNDFARIVLEISILNNDDFSAAKFKTANQRGSLSAIRLVDNLDARILRCHCIDRKSTRLNSSHLGISYAVFCY